MKFSLKHLKKDLDPQKRKELLARFYMDLGKIDSKLARKILDSFFDQKLLEYSEYKKLENLLF